jgi:hypothetical protein
MRAVGIISLLVWPVLRTFFIDKLSLLSKSCSSGHPVLVTTQRGKEGSIIDVLDCGHGGIWVSSAGCTHVRHSIACFQLGSPGWALLCVELDRTILINTKSL